MRGIFVLGEWGGGEGGGGCEMEIFVGRLWVGCRREL